MARCSYHPDVETGLSCTACGKPICPKEMVDSPVGYKCPDCARQPSSALVRVKPKQLAIASLVALLVGGGTGALLGLIGFGGFFLLGFAWGALVAEAVRRGSGGHRGPIVATIAIAGVGFGWVVSMVVGGYIWPVTALVAAIVAGAMLARG